MEYEFNNLIIRLALENTEGHLSAFNALSGWTNSSRKVFLAKWATCSIHYAEAFRFKISQIKKTQNCQYGH